MLAAGIVPPRFPQPVPHVTTEAAPAFPDRGGMTVMIRSTWFTRLLVAAIAAAGSATTASAGLLPVSVTINQEGTNAFRWTYAIVLPTDMKLEAGNYFTIYDFNGYLNGGEKAPEGWEFSTKTSGPTPDHLKP